MDIDKPGLARARRRFGGEVTFLRADGTRLPWPDASVDAVVFSHIYRTRVSPKPVDGIPARGGPPSRRGCDPECRAALRVMSARRGPVPDDLDDLSR